MSQPLAESARREGAARLRRAEHRFAPEPSRSWVGRLDHAFDELVEQSGLETTPATALAGCMAVAALAAGAMFVWQENLFSAALGFLLGLAGTLSALAAARAWRLRQIGRQLPEAIDRLARSVRAGRSLEQAIAVLADELSEPLGSEFRRVAQRLELGLPLPAALRLLVRRAPLPPLHMFVAALTIQRQVGGNVVETLEQLSRTVRQRADFRARFRAATAGSRMSVIFLLSVGPIALVVQTFRDPEYMATLTSTPVGRTLLGTAIILQLIGSIWVWSIFKAGITRANF